MKSDAQKDEEQGRFHLRDARALIGDRRVGELSPRERIIAGILWMVDNEGYGINSAADDILGRLGDL